MTNEEARARLIVLAQNEPKGVQRDALIMGANALIDDVNNIWLQEHDKRIRAEVIDESYEQGRKDMAKEIISQLKGDTLAGMIFGVLLTMPEEEREELKKKYEEQKGE